MTHTIGEYNPDDDSKLNITTKTTKLKRTHMKEIKETIQNVTDETHIEIIGASGLIDEIYYANNNPEDKLDDLVEDYYFLGCVKGVPPSFLFNTQYYIMNNRDVVEADINPLVHYITNGEEEGRAPCDFVDLEHLKNQIPDSINCTYLAYFYNNETELGISAHPYFDTEYYLATNNDVAEAGISPYHHFIAKGAFEGRSPRMDIDFADYLESNVIDTNKNHPFLHFIRFSNHSLEIDMGLSNSISILDGTSSISNVIPLTEKSNVSDMKEEIPTIVQAEQEFQEVEQVQETILEKIEVPQDMFEVIGKSEIFDVDYYLCFINDIAPYDNPIQHYIAVGHDQLFDPSPFFSTKFYLASNPEVKENKTNSLYHYVTIGESEGRKPNPLFAPHEYLELNEDLTDIKRSLLGHYCHCGIYEGRSFAKNKLLNEAPSIEVVTEPAEVTEENPKLIFDAHYYLTNNNDVREAGIDPLAHYFNAGEKEGRKPNSYFDPLFYYAINPDIRILGLSAFEHFSGFGFYEGREGIETKVNNRSHAIKPLLFVGHDGIQAGSEIVLLEIIKWFYEHTNRRLKVLLLSPGPVANQYVKYADVLVLPENTVDDPELLKLFLKEDFEFAYLNTVVSGKVFDILDEYKIKFSDNIITHIHEMEKVIAENLSSFKRLVKHSKHFISASPATTATLVDKHKLLESDITTVPAFIRIVDPELTNLTSLKSSMRAELSIPENAIVVGGCGTVYWRKGPDIFLESARRVLNEESPEIHFVWIGPGPDLETLKSSITEEEANYIHFIGERSDANKAIAVADIFYMCSREDPFPLVVMESAQHCIPTICFSEATGITAFIKDDAGICLDFIDAQKGAEAILMLANDRNMLNKMGNVARERVTGNYTSEIQCLNIYKALEEFTTYQPSVSVVIPMYNHEDFIDERIQSVLNQNIKDIEVIVLDDCSKDESIVTAKKYENDFRLSVTTNIKNTGSPFAQWKKGLIKAKSDVLWIAEGDDSCDDNFISTLLPYFDDPMVNIASGKTVIMDEKGTLNPLALEPYLDRAYQDKYKSSFIIDGFEEVNQNFGAVCTLVNASGLLIRKSSVDLSILEEAGSFKMCGDWLIYLASLRGGKLAYDVSTHNYFRRHSASVVNKIEGSEIYFNERYKISEFVFKNFNLSKKLIRRTFEAIDGEWARFSYKHDSKTLNDLYDKNKLTTLATENQTAKHIGLYVHGMLFSKGGIERLAADLANYFVEQGYKVTIYARNWGNKTTSVYSLYENVAVKGIFDETQQESSIKQLRKSLLDDDIDVFIPMLSEWLFTPIVEAAKHTGIPVIASEHNDPWKIEELWWKRSERLKCFEQVEYLHLLLNKFSDSLPAELQGKVSTIPNGIELPEYVAPYAQREKLIVGIGRLAEQKRFDRLIDAVALIKDPLIEAGWRVEIYGEGHLREELQTQIEELELNDLIVLKGLTNDISAILNKAAINVMPSEFEGFGIALVEAMAHGLPSIAFTECNGPNEIISSKTGVLVDSVPALSENLRLLISNEKKRTVMSKNAVFSAKKYQKKEVFPLWIEMINKVIG
ncbi:glycosyltransferase [Psychromonas sp. SA13A]|uniref:glycosyltransferase n=1 Tax=Psychromonas sp. SA13A TaxID=2686346 RepID=UPI0014092FF9|nr:glycosyltransferase [Psychromonas sp. SA13A]